MKVIILGGDGYIGWPLALRLSKNGHKVHIVDNFSRREVDKELQVDSLTPIEDLDKRIKVWNDEICPGNQIQFSNIDVSKDYEKMYALFSEFKPETIFHLAEFKSAPYSMRSALHKIDTIGHNVNAANIILSSIIESNIDAHLVHIGTMGVYGYSSGENTFIPEGYIDADLQFENNYSERRNILYPFNPGSIYHLSKSLDNLIFQFYNKNDNLQITDLHQGIVWGSQTDETKLNDALINRFDYDGDYGTVLNRFLIQAAVNFPLTVHGTGNQTRALINLNDTIKCLEIAMLNPPKSNERVRIFNQVAETNSVIALANMISKITNCKIDYLDNPRNEAEANDLTVKNDQLKSLGFKPVYLNEASLAELYNFAKKYSNRCDLSKIPSKPKWKNNNKQA